MFDELIENRAKGGWDHCNIGWLITRMDEELHELKNAVDVRNWKEAITECADVANFAMMVAERIQAVHKDDIEQ